MDPGEVADAFLLGVELGRQLERERLAERVDDVDAQWTSPPRLTYAQRVARRAHEMTLAGRRFRRSIGLPEEDDWPGGTPAEAYARYMW